MQAIQAIYNPDKKRLDFIGSDGMATCSIMGEHAHLKAIEYVAKGGALTVSINSRLNRL